MEPLRAFVLVNRLNPKKVPWSPQVTDVEVILQIGFHRMNTSLITPSHKNVINVDCKNDKATLSLLRELITCIYNLNSYPN